MRLLVTILVIVALTRLEASDRFPSLDPARRRWRRLRPRLADFARRAPGTFGYLFVVAVTTWVLRGSSPAVARLLFRERSSNLHHLTHDPIRVLIGSAFWLSDARLLPWAVLFSLVLAPAEHWLGTSRWLLAFAAGHVGATLITVAGIWAGIRAHRLDPALAYALDVGVSYGFAAVAALLTFRLPARWRPPYAIGLLGYAGLRLAVGGTFTDQGTWSPY